MITYQLLPTSSPHPLSLNPLGTLNIAIPKEDTTVALLEDKSPTWLFWTPLATDSTDTKRGHSTGWILAPKEKLERWHMLEVRKTVWDPGTLSGPS